MRVKKRASPIEIFAAFTIHKYADDKFHPTPALVTDPALQPAHFPHFYPSAFASYSSVITYVTPLHIDLHASTLGSGIVQHPHPTKAPALQPPFPAVYFSAVHQESLSHKNRKTRRAEKRGLTNLIAGIFHPPPPSHPTSCQDARRSEPSFRKSEASLETWPRAALSKLQR